MMRVLGLLGFAGGFLIISPALRQMVMDGANSAGQFASEHSPYSYVGLAILVFGGVTLSLRTGQSVR